MAYALMWINMPGWGLLTHCDCCDFISVVAEVTVMGWPTRSNLNTRRVSRWSASLVAAVVMGSLCGTPSAQVVFDFDSAPYQSSLPVSLTVAGLTAQLSATGQGYSIQAANVLGFTPLGFAGYVVYPNSVYPADLSISFSQPIDSFSILCAPEEYACDTSATLRATGYRTGVFVATSTTSAPNPGTWPTATLNLSSPQGFDTVIVHYDAPPPTGGDWGPIFMADYMVVTVADRVFANGFE